MYLYLWFSNKKGAPFNGIEHENYHNNQLKSEINYKDGKKMDYVNFGMITVN